MKDLTRVIVALALFGIACGDDDPADGDDATGGGGSGTATTSNSTSTGGMPGPTADSYCAEVAAHDKQCQVGNMISTSQCLGDTVTKCMFGGNMRAGVDQQIMQCVLDRPCVDDPFLYYECTEQPGEMAPAQGQAAFKQACIDLLFMCGTFDDDTCYLNFFEPAAYEDLSACMATDDCFAVEPCVNAVLAELCP